MDIIIIILICLSILLSLVIYFIIGILTWNNFKSFFHHNYSFFDVTFVLAYFIEQLILQILFIKYPLHKDFWISFFALIILTTVALQKVSMESRNRKISKENLKTKILYDRSNEAKDKLMEKNQSLEKTIREMKEFIRELMDEIEILNTKS